MGAMLLKIKCQDAYSVQKHYELREFKYLAQLMWHNLDIPSVLGQYLGFVREPIRFHDTVPHIELSFLVDNI